MLHSLCPAILNIPFTPGSLYSYSTFKSPLTVFPRFLQAGASKVYITSRKAKACEEAVAALNALPNKCPGAQAFSVPADSATIEGVDSLVAQVKKTTDHVDILFANAGATWGESFDTHPDKAFGKVMDLNVKSVFNTVQKYVSAIAPLPSMHLHSTAAPLLPK